MLKTKRCMQLFTVLSATALTLSACGGGGQQQQQPQMMGGQQMPGGQQQMGGAQQGGPPHTMTDVQGGWKRVAILGTNTSFEMPQPIDAQQIPQNGMLKYTSKQGKRSFTVGVVSRQYERDKKQGVTNEAALETWADQILNANKMVFQQMKLPMDIKFVGKFNVGDAMAVQYSGKVGKANVTYICYVTNLALYYQEVITQNPQSPEVNRFISNFKP